MSIEENKQVARRAFEALIAGDLSPLEKLLSPDALLHQCGFLEPFPVRAILRGELPMRARLADRQIQLERIIAEGDLVALHWRTTGLHRDGDLPEPDGRRVSFSSMSFIRMDNGKIAEIWNIQDVSTLQTQLRDVSEPMGSR